MDNKDNLMPTKSTTYIKWKKSLKETITKIGKKKKKKEQHICEIEFIPTEETPDADGFTGKFYQTFQEEKIANLTQMIYKIENKVTFLNYFMKLAFS